MTKDLQKNSQSLDQKRAKAAWEAVTKARDQLKGDFKEYVSLVKKFPALMMRNGLGPAVAFLMSKAKKKEESPHGLLKKHIEEWLCQKALHSPYYTSAAKKESLVEAITERSSMEYFLASEEALLYLQWLKLFASALSEDK